MKTAIFDIETSGLYTNFAILLCVSIKDYEKNGVRTYRADDYPTWKNNRTESRELVLDVLNDLKDYDVLVAHNGQYFDKQWLNTLALYHGYDPAIRWTKMVDPVLLSRRHLRLGRNTLAQLVDYFDIPIQKTHVSGKLWMRAALEGDKKAMNEIVRHCELDVKTLECIYDKVRKLVEKIDNRGSAQ
jgi:uncharacterized protein YprB with RNaseH-like and TPR domain